MADDNSPKLVCIPTAQVTWWRLGEFRRTVSAILVGTDAEIFVLPEQRWPALILAVEAGPVPEGKLDKRRVLTGAIRDYAGALDQLEGALRSMLTADAERQLVFPLDELHRFESHIGFIGADLDLKTEREPDGVGANFHDRALRRSLQTFYGRQRLRQPSRRARLVGLGIYQE